MRLTNKELADIDRIKESIKSLTKKMTYDQLMEIHTWDSPTLLRIIDRLVLEAKLLGNWEENLDDQDEEPLFGKIHLD